MAARRVTEMGDINSRRKTLKTEILFILDRSGSMASCATDAVGGFNSFLKDQKKEPKGKRLSLLQFDNHREYTYDRAKLKDCKKLVLGETYVPRGSTALLDAIGMGVNRLEKAEKAIVAVYTDGHENNSQEWTAEAVKKLLKKCEKKGWEVLFLSADVDTTYATQTLGMSKHRVAGGAGVAAAAATFSMRASKYANTGVASQDSLQADLKKTYSE